MEIASYLSLIQRRWWLLLGVPLLLGLFVFLTSRSSTDVYSATARLLINNRPIAPTPSADPESTPSAQPNLALNDLLPNERVLATSIELVSRRAVLEEVIRSLALPYSEGQLRDRLSARVVSGTQLIEITAEDPNPSLAAAIANETSAAFIRISQQETGQNSIAVANPAEVPATPIENGILQSVILAVVMGLFLSAALALLLDYLDDRIRTPEDVEAIAGWAPIGVIDRFRNQKAHPATVSAAEDYRELRSHIRALHDVDNLKTILITSPGRGEGRSLTALNLGYMLAESGDSVLLIDADLRQPSLHRLIGSDNRAGLSDILRQKRPLGNWTVEPGSLKVLTAGTPPGNPSIISSSRTEEVLGELRHAADYLILDSPALTSVADAGEIARFVDGVIVLAEAGRTRADALKTAVAMLERGQASVIGVVINKGRGLHKARRSYKTRQEHTDAVALPQREESVVAPAPPPVETPPVEKPPPRVRRAPARPRLTNSEPSN